ncbi:MAG: radical SAM protein [bacterium]
MTIESVQDRIRLIRRLMDRCSSYQINAIPLPAGRRSRPLSATEVAPLWRELAQEQARGGFPGHYLNLFLHIPFCRARCTFCMYDSRIARDRSEISGTMDAMQRELAHYAPALEGVRLQNLYLGGGTPTLLEEDQLRALLGTVFEGYQFAADGSRVIETNPDNVTPEKAALLASYGFNKVSVGVQSLDPTVLERHGRGHQTRAQVRAAVERLRAAGTGQVNCDLVMGLAGETAETFVGGVRELLSFGPDTVMLSKLQPAPPYLERHFDGRHDQFVAHYDTSFRQALDKVLTVAEECGYTTDNPYANELGWRLWKRGFEPPYDISRPYYCTGGELPSSTLGVGCFARSRIFGRLTYETSGQPSTFVPQEPRYRGVDIDLRYEQARWVINQLSRTRELVRATFRSHFGADPEQAFPQVLE